MLVKATSCPRIQVLECDTSGGQMEFDLLRMFFRGYGSGHISTRAATPALLDSLLSLFELLFPPLTFLPVMMTLLVLQHASCASV